MKKILFFILLSMSVTCFGQETQSIDSIQTTEADSIHAGSHTFSDTKLEDVTKAEGDSAYIKADYATAIQIYESLLKNGESADVYYNLGNSYYKAGEIAKAVLNYERALLMKPGNSDIRANLEVARAKTIDKVEPVPEVFFVSWAKALINSMSVDAWATWGIVSFILFIIALYFFIFSKQIILKKGGFISGIVFLIVVICSNLFASEQKERLVNRSEAIVMNPSVTVRSTPSESGTSLFILHEGRKVSIKDNSMKEWKEIRLEDGKVGAFSGNSPSTSTSRLTSSVMLCIFSTRSLPPLSQIMSNVTAPSAAFTSFCFFMVSTSSSEKPTVEIRR